MKNSSGQHDYNSAQCEPIALMPHRKQGGTCTCSKLNNGNARFVSINVQEQQFLAFLKTTQCKVGLTVLCFFVFTKKAKLQKKKEKKRKKRKETKEPTLGR